MLDFSLYSREVFLNAKNNLCVGSDVEQAYNFFIVNRQCFNGKNKSWGMCNKANKTFFMYEQRIREAHERIKKVFIEHMDFRELIQKYDSPDALFLCDPPYMFNESRRRTKAYENEMSEQDHAELVELLKTIKGKFLLCGYSNSLYDCFDKISIGESNMCVNVKLGGEGRIKKQEYLWKNF